MKNKLLPAIFLFLNGALLSAQSGNASITISGNVTCACEGCFLVAVNNINLPCTLLWSNGITSTMTTNPAW